MKKVIVISLWLFMTILFGACNNKNAYQDDNKLQVSVTFNAMAELAQAVGQDKIEVSTIIPAGSEPHNFEPKALDITKLSKGQIFIYQGLGMEPWVEETIAAANNPSLIVVEASKGATPITSSEEESHSNTSMEADASKDGHTQEDEHTQEEESSHDHSHGEYDPHLWLSIKGAQIIVNNIADALVEADQANKDFYLANASDYNAELENLYTEYSEKFESLENKNFVTGHAAFGYFCKDFSLVQNSVANVFAEGEPSTKQLASLVDYCKENKVKTIFAEKMANPEISQTLATEINATVTTIYTMEGPEDNLNYMERIRSNCENVYNSLKQ